MELSKIEDLEKLLEIIDLDKIFCGPIGRIKEENIKKIDECIQKLKSESNYQLRISAKIKFGEFKKEISVRPVFDGNIVAPQKTEEEKYSITKQEVYIECVKEEGDLKLFLYANEFVKKYISTL